VRVAAIVCGRCRQEYPRLASIAVVMPQVAAHLSMWRGQLELIAAQAEEQFSHLEAEARAPGVLPDGQRRLLALAGAVRDQVENVVSAFAPVLAASGEVEPMAPLPPGAQTPLKYIHYLYRDWAWEQVGYDENQRTVAALREVVSAPPLGRTLVFGAGGCRLPYELHRNFGCEETVVLDIDPFTFVVAEAVVRGKKVPMTEANVSVQETVNAARAWVLSAPAGPLGDNFHFMLANGLAPPFAPGTFDTVVTPWFIDQVPPDMGKFFETLAQMLKPGGRWLNQGPLLYPAELPLVRRHTREEIFDLAGRAGFRIGKWTGESRPYLISPLNGRGRVEWVLTFEAVLDPKVAA
jgi:SAM-dependent methyltransferase